MYHEAMDFPISFWKFLGLLEGSTPDPLWVRLICPSVLPLKLRLKSRLSRIESFL